jgi:magnesium transporter
MAIKKFSYKHIDWIDLESPKEADIELVKNRYHIDPAILDDLFSPTIKPRFDFFENHAYMVLHFPIYDRTRNIFYNREVDFILGKDFVITVHYEDVPQLHDLSKIFQGSDELEKGSHSAHPGFLFFYIMRHLYVSLEDELETIEAGLSFIEERIFAGEEREMVLRLSAVGRLFVDFSRSIKGHRDVLRQFEELAASLYGAEFLYYAKLISGEFNKITDIVEGIRDTFHELRQTNDSLLSTKTNDIMKFLTIMAFITFPLSLVAGIFGMNTNNTPIIGSDLDFWFIIGLMFTLTLIFFIFFKYKRWL